MATTFDGDLQALLERLEAHWRQQRAPIAAALLPGLGDAQIDHLIAPLRIELPDEIRTWWRWRGGVPASAGRRARRIGPGWEYLSLNDSVAMCHAKRATAAEESAGSVERWWLDTWIPIAASMIQPTLAADCSRPHALAPILVVDPGSDPEYFTPKAPSLTAVVAIWVDAFDTGVISYDADRGEWHRGDVPIELDRLLL